MKLDIVFVFDQWRGRGIGRRLINTVGGLSAEFGAPQLRILSQPWAECFFVHVGAHRVGSQPPDDRTAWYRPIFEIDLDRGPRIPLDQSMNQ